MLNSSFCLNCEWSELWPCRGYHSDPWVLGLEVWLRMRRSHQEFLEKGHSLTLSLSLSAPLSLPPSLPVNLQNFKGVLELCLWQSMTAISAFVECWMTPGEERQYQRAAVPMWQMRHMSLRAYWSEQNKRIQNECKQLCEYASVKHFDSGTSWAKEQKWSGRKAYDYFIYGHHERWDTAFWLFYMWLRAWNCLCACLCAHKVPPCRQAAAIDLTRSWGSEDGDGRRRM